MKQYYIFKNNQQVGPMTADQLVQQGLEPNTLIWSAGMTEWLPASQVAELAAYFNPVPPPAPVPQPQRPVQPIQPQYQQPVQPQYQQPVQPQYQQSQLQDNQASLPVTISQKVFRAILAIPLIFLIVMGFIYTIYGLFLFDSYHSFFGYIPHNVRGFVRGTVFLMSFWMLIMTACAVIALVRIFKVQGLGFVSIGLFLGFLITFLLTGIITSFRDFPIELIIIPAVCMIIAFFATVPIEELNNGKRYLAIFSETKAIEYTLLGLLFVVPIVFLIIGLYVT